MDRPQQVSDCAIYEATVEIVSGARENFSTRAVALKLGITPQAIVKRLGSKEALLCQSFVYFFNSTFENDSFAVADEVAIGTRFMEYGRWLHRQLQTLDQFRSTFFANQVNLRLLYAQFETPPPLVIISRVQNFVQEAMNLNLTEQGYAHQRALTLFGAVGHHAHLSAVLPDFERMCPQEMFLEGVCDLLSKSSSTDTLSSVGLPVEIERKYLLTAMPDLKTLNVERVWHIEQGYIPGGTITERIRRAVCGDVVKCTRTVKLGAGVRRIEFEDEIDEALFSKLWSATEGSRVTKQRHVVSHDGGIWELDQFTDRELVLLEIELSSEQEAISMPEPFLTVLAGEVTTDKNFTNWALSRKNVASSSSE